MPKPAIRKVKPAVGSLRAIGPLLFGSFSGSPEKNKKIDGIDLLIFRNIFITT
jgi:hypothetical protein